MGVPLDASLFANSVSRATFDAMQSAIDASLPDFVDGCAARRACTGTPVAAVVGPGRSTALAPGASRWAEGIGLVRDAFSSYSPALVGVVDRAIDERVDRRRSREGKQGGAFCMSFVGDRSLVLLNWSGGSSRHRPLRTNSGTPITTCSWRTAPRFSVVCRWRWPRPPASSARRWWSRTVSII